MSNYTFAQLRLQLIEQAISLAGLTDRAFRLIIHLIIRHLNRRDGTCHINDTALAIELECCTDTISRAVACAEKTGLLVVQRGRWLRSTHYAMSPQAWQAAEGQRRKTGKSAEQGTPQICDDLPAKLPSSTPQKCGSFYRNEVRDKRAGGDTTPVSVPSVPDTGLSPTAQVQEHAPSTFVALKSFHMKSCNERLHDFGLPHIERWMSQDVADGKVGFLLPALWPASKDSTLWQEQFAILRNLYRESQRGGAARHGL